MSKKLRISILSLSLLTVMTVSAVAPALGVIQEAFQGVKPLYIKLILTLPAIILIPISLISGKLVQFYSKKKIIMIGLLLYLIGGVGAGFSENIFQLLSFRILLGMGLGLILPLSTGLIADFYDGSQRAKMMGYSTAVNNLGGVIATLLSGILAAISWRYIFAIYLISGIVFTLISLFLEDQPLSVKEKGRREKMNSNVWKIALSIFMIYVIFGAVPTNLSLFLVEFQLGQSGASGILIALLTFSSFMAGLLFFKISKLLKTLKIVIPLLIMFIGFLILSYTLNIILIGVAIICIGIGLGLLLPTFMLATTKAVSKDQTSYALAIVSSSMFFGQFISPIFTAFLQNIMNSTSTRIAFYTSSILALISILIAVLNRSKGFNRLLSTLGFSHN